jgi:hypothetical protein
MNTLTYFSPEGRYTGSAVLDGPDGAIVSREARIYTGNNLTAIEKYDGGSTGVSPVLVSKQTWAYGATGSSAGKLVCYERFDDGVTCSYKETDTYDESGRPLEHTVYANGVDASCCSGTVTETDESGNVTVRRYCNDL